MINTCNYEVCLLHIYHQISQTFKWAATTGIFVKFWVRIELLCLADDFDKFDPIFFIDLVCLLMLKKPDQQTVDGRMIDAKKNDFLTKLLCNI